jgi:SAM-dependent methyltransferase
MNRDSYNAIAASWDQARRSLSARERPYLDVFLANLAVGSHILDLGCGTGRPIAEHILSRGHQITASIRPSGLSLSRARAFRQHAGSSSASSITNRRSITRASYVGTRYSTSTVGVTRR